MPASLPPTVLSQTQLRIIAHRPQVPGPTLTVTTTNTRCEGRLYHMSGAVPCHDIRVVVGNFYVPSTGAGETLNGSAVTWEAVFEMASPSKAYRFTFNGSPTVTVEPGGIVVSDPLGIDLAANTQFWIRSGVTVASAGLKWPVGFANSGSGEVFFESTSASSQIFGTGTLSNPSGGTGGNGGQGVMAVLGVPSAPQACMQIWGDSLTEGSGDTVDTTSAIQGPVARALYRNGNPIPHIKHAKVGDKLIPAAAQATGFQRRFFAQYANNFYVGLASNDISAGASLSSIQTALTSLVTSLRRRGTCRIFCPSVTTRTTSTDNWATTANQTVSTGFTVGGVADQWNTWLATQVGGLIEGFIDLRGASQDGANKWLVNGTAQYATVDGTHGSPATYTAWAALVANIIPNLLVS